MEESVVHVILLPAGNQFYQFLTHLSVYVPSLFHTEQDESYYIIHEVQLSLKHILISRLVCLQMTAHGTCHHYKVVEILSDGIHIRGVADSAYIIMV